ncbi:hypothetical protein [Aggregatilinea lenta]|uniref:hypothetical protein n=1 Tax=Aggregatilinea lenta TaxID=913108 RepID=UPI000E5A8B50|nr:hypothetical protein [Aggregatilinea lenta]
MKTLISGSRDIPDLHSFMEQVIRRLKENGDGLIVGDNAHGVDQLAIYYAYRYDLPTEVFGCSKKPRAKLYTNQEYMFNVRMTYTERDRFMVSAADRGIFIWNGQSKGTKAAYDHMLSLHKPVFLYSIPYNRWR